MKKALAMLVVALVSATLLTAQETAGSRKPMARKKTAAASVTAERLKALQDAVNAQSQQIQALTQQVQNRDQVIQKLQDQVAQVQSMASEANAKAQAAVPATDFTSLRTDVSDIKSNATTTALAVQEEQKRVNEMVESPIAIHFKGVTLTPGGFLAAESVWRQRGTASDVNTPFNSIPFSGAGASHLSEFFGSGRQSRISLLAEGKLSSAKLTGYFETDWLSAGVTSNNNQSNSYTNRQRQIWGQAALTSGWAFTGGQMWSLATETKKGLDNRTEALPMTIDAQYHVGFSWARQWGFRVTKNLSNKVWIGASVENPQTTFTAHGNSANFDIGALGTGGGLYNTLANYSFNRTPDFIVKMAFEPGFGHYEIFGILSTFRDRVYPNATATTPSSAGAFTDSRTGGGGGVNARWLAANKHVEIGIHALAGDGVGRYGTSSLPDATVRPDGTLSLIHSYQGLGTIELHSKKWDVYTYAGGEYAARTFYLTSPTKAVGYGAPVFVNSSCLIEAIPGGGNGFTPGMPASSTCTGDTRNLIEGTFGFWYKLYNGPKGRIQFGPQYSYIIRNTWAGAGGEPHAVENMVLTSFRYYLP